MHGWKGNMLSKASKEVLIKAVIQAIPTYTMGVFLLPMKLRNELNSMRAQFWWGNIGHDHKIGWDGRSLLCPSRRGVWVFEIFDLLIWLCLLNRDVNCHRSQTHFFLSVSKLGISLVVIFWMLRIAQTALTLGRVWWRLNLFLLFVGMWGMVRAFVLFMILGFQTSPLGRLYTSLICWSLIIVSMSWLITLSMAGIGSSSPNCSTLRMLWPPSRFC